MFSLKMPIHKNILPHNDELHDNYILTVIFIII